MALGCSVLIHGMRSSRHGLLVVMAIHITQPSVMLGLVEGVEVLERRTPIEVSSATLEQ